ncbi:hypothetical protein [Psychrobacter ciconiae]|uniref:hypothetical protein n=1 Tax=Psychrobacter ciconiae TaxID=1553449 RepID=UPI001918E2A6|nr:hypothetical protein [Psychrobacter ciconiae]
MADIESWLNKISNRELNFIAYILKFYGYPLILPANRELILNNIKDMNTRESNKIEDIKNFYRSKMIDESLFDWMKEDVRALLWMCSFYFCKSQFYDVPKNNIQALPTLLENLMFNIDSSFVAEQSSPLPILANPAPYMPFNQGMQNNIFTQNFIQNPMRNFALEKKSYYLNFARNIFNIIKTDRKNTNWIDKENEEQLYWAVDYLKNNNLLIINNFIAYTNGDLYNHICASLDAIDSNAIWSLDQVYSPTAHKQLIISKMRKAWSQKKFRDKKDIESAQELLLTSEYKNKLNKLAKTYNVDPVKYLKDLIDNEADQL